MKWIIEPMHNLNDWLCIKMTAKQVEISIHIAWCISIEDIYQLRQVCYASFYEDIDQKSIMSTWHILLEKHDFLID